MNTLQVHGDVKQSQIEAVIVRADGTRVELGTIAYWHKNPVVRWFRQVLITVNQRAKRVNFTR